MRARRIRKPPTQDSIFILGFVERKCFIKVKYMKKINKILDYEESVFFI